MSYYKTLLVLKVIKLQVACMTTEQFFATLVTTSVVMPNFVGINAQVSGFGVQKKKH